MKSPLLRLIGISAATCMIGCCLAEPSDTEPEGVALGRKAAAKLFDPSDTVLSDVQAFQDAVRKSERIKIIVNIIREGKETGVVVFDVTEDEFRTLKEAFLAPETVYDNTVWEIDWDMDPDDEFPPTPGWIVFCNKDGNRLRTLSVDLVSNHRDIDYWVVMPAASYVAVTCIFRKHQKSAH